MVPTRRGVIKDAESSYRYDVDRFVPFFSVFVSDLSESELEVVSRGQPSVVEKRGKLRGHVVTTTRPHTCVVNRLCPHS